MQKQESTAPSVALAEEPADYGGESHMELPDAPEPQLSVPSLVAPNEAPLMTVEVAVGRIGEVVLNHFKEQFNGKPSEMRHIDDKDRIFENESQS